MGAALGGRNAMAALLLHRYDQALTRLAGTGGRLRGPLAAALR